MARWAKCLLFAREGLGLDPRHPHRSQEPQCWPATLVPWRRRPGRSPELISESSCLQRRGRGQGRHLWSLCKCTRACTLKHVCTHPHNTHTCTTSICTGQLPSSFRVSKETTEVGSGWEGSGREVWGSAKGTREGWPQAAVSHSCQKLGPPHEQV